MKPLFIILSLFITTLGFGQDTELLTLPKAITYALDHKAEAEQARLDIEMGDAQIAEVKASAYPNVSISSTTSYNPLLQETVLPGEVFGMPGEKMRVAFGQRWIASANAQVTQVLFNQSVFTGLKAARSTKEFYQVNAQLTDEQIIERVANAYFQVYQADQMLENLDSTLSITRETVNIIKGLFDAGLAKKIDYDRSNVVLNNIVASRQQLVNAVQISENALKFMIGMPMEQEIELPATTFDTPKMAAYDSTLTNNRTEVKVLEKQIELLNWQKKASEAAYYPTVALAANYGAFGQGDKVPWWHGERNGVFWSDVSGINLQVNIPIFNGFATRSRIRINDIEIRKAEAGLRDVKLGLDLEQKNAVTQINNNLITIKTQEANVSLAEEVLANTQNNYRYGLATLNDLLDAERDLSDARNNLTRAQLDYKLAEIELLKSQGALRILNLNN